jgi:hypothetical protein
MNKKIPAAARKGISITMAIHLFTYIGRYLRISIADWYSNVKGLLSVGVRKSCGILVLGLIVMSMLSSVSSAKSPSSLQVVTDNAELNEEIASGAVRVDIYDEPTAKQKAAMTEQLKKLGYTDQELKAKPWAIKEFLVTNRLSKKTATTSGLVEKSQSRKNQLGDVGIASLNDDMSWTQWSANVGTRDENRIAMYGNFDWYSMPFWQLTDKVGFAWAADNGDTWASRSISINAYHHGCRQQNFRTVCRTLRTSSSTVTDSKANVGVGAKYNVLGTFLYQGYQYTVDDVYGDAAAIIRRPKNGGNQRRQLVSVAEYAHKEYACNFSLTFAKDPNVGVSCPLANDITESLGDYVEYYD